MHRLIYILLTLLLVAQPASAGKVLLKILASNPADKPQQCEIKSNLPARIRPDDVISHDGLELGYDIKNDIYFVHKVELLAPGATSDYTIEINDIWVIPEKELKGMRSRSSELAKKLEGSEYEPIVKDVAQAVSDRLKMIEGRQSENLIRADNAIDHIQAYERSLKDMKRVKLRVGHLENLVLMTGQDPEGLVGTVKDMPKPDRDIRPDKYGTAIIKITVENPSPTEVRIMGDGATPRLERMLPPEILPEDIDLTGAPEMKVGTYPESGRSFVYVEKLKMEPKEVKTFTVKITDKWNINGQRTIVLRTSAEELLVIVQTKASVKSVEESLERMIGQLAAIEKEDGPETLDQHYVAFFRDQARRLDRLEDQINRIKSALKPRSNTSKMGFKAKPPSMKTTWLIIYIILGFLALFSILFFLRWYGKSKSEELGGIDE